MDRLLLALLLSTLVSASSTSRAADDKPAWPDLSTDAGVQGGGEHDAALVVGVGAYYNLPAIDGAVDNATAWQQWLLRSRKLRPDRVVLLANREATKGKIEKNLKALAADVAPQGTLWFVFIGHGAPSAGGDDGLLLGVDTDADADSIAERGVAQKTVLSLVATGKQAQSVVVFDACFSGRTGDGAQALVPGLQATLPTRRLLPAAKTTILAASDSFAGPLPGAGRPAFSYLLLGALRGWADDDGDSSVSVDEAIAFSRGTIQALFKGADRLPSRSGPAVVLAKNAREEKPDLAALLSGRCPTGSRWTGRGCKELPRVECPAGTSWNGSACASDCPAGTSWNGRACAAQVVHCPAGTEWNGSACQGGCPKGTRWNGSACEGEHIVPPPVTVGVGSPDDAARAPRLASLPRTTATAVCPDGMGFVPGGSLSYGASRDDPQRGRSEPDATIVHVDSFCIDYYEAPNGKDTEPIGDVSWFVADAACQRAGKRLCTEREWERACKGPSSLRFPYGPGYDATVCNVADEDGAPAELARATAFKRCRSDFRIYMLSGNVEEWVADPESGSLHVARGGSAAMNGSASRCAARALYPGRSTASTRGFRCCAGAPASAPAAAEGSSTRAAPGATLTFVTTPPGATVEEVTGGRLVVVGTTPLKLDWPLAAGTGPREFLLKKPGFVTARARVDAPSSDELRRGPVEVEITATLREP